MSLRLVSDDTATPKLAEDARQLRLPTAQWIFERHLAWIAAAEVKVGAIVTIIASMLGDLVAA
jgi:hypothetical protein